MKFLVFLLIQIGFLLFGCKKPAETNKIGNIEIEYVGCLPVLDKIIFFQNDIQRLKIKQELQQYFNQIIEEEKICKCYDSIAIAFLIKASTNNGDTTITITSINKFVYDYSKVYGVAEYSEYLFFFEGINTDLFFAISDERLCFNSLMPKKEEYYDIDDSKTAWFYKLHKNKIEFDYHFECQKNEKYERIDFEGFYNDSRVINWYSYPYKNY
jgi:hypothetical protein